MTKDSLIRLLLDIQKETETSTDEIVKGMGRILQTLATVAEDETELTALTDTIVRFIRKRMSGESSKDSNISLN